METKSKFIIDWKKLQPITKECEHYLAKFISEVENDRTHGPWLIVASYEFGWNKSCPSLKKFVDNKFMELQAFRMNTARISSCDILSAIFGRGNWLDAGYVLLLMYLLNRKVDLQPKLIVQDLSDLSQLSYQSGIEMFFQFPEPLKSILCILDAAALAREGVSIED